jgi:hypothetical protein
MIYPGGLDENTGSSLAWLLHKADQAKDGCSIEVWTTHTSEGPELHGIVNYGTKDYGRVFHSWQELVEVLMRLGDK